MLPTAGADKTEGWRGGEGGKEEGIGGKEMASEIADAITGASSESTADVLAARGPGNGHRKTQMQVHRAH